MTHDLPVAETLQRRANLTDVPVLDGDVLDALVAGGWRARRRRTATTLAVAAAVVVAVAGAGVALGGQDAPAPVPVDSVEGLPDGPPPLPVVGDDTSMTLRYGGGRTLGWSDGRGVVRVYARGVETLDPHGRGIPSVSADGQWAAWPRPSGKDGTPVLVWDFDRSREVGLFTVPEVPQCCDSGFAVVAVLDSGQVVVRGDQGYYLGSAGDGVRPLEGLDDPDLQGVAALPQGIVAEYADGSTGERRYRVGELLGGDFYEEIAFDSADGPLSWAPDDTKRYAFVDDAHDRVVVETPTGEMTGVPVPLGPRQRMETVLWESPAALLVLVDVRAGQALVRCTVDNRSCELARPPAEGLLNLPTR